MGSLSELSMVRCLYMLLRDGSSESPSDRYTVTILMKVHFGGTTYYACPSYLRHGPQDQSGCKPLTSQQLTNELRLSENVDNPVWYVGVIA